MTDLNTRTRDSGALDSGVLHDSNEMLLYSRVKSNAQHGALKGFARKEHVWNIFNTSGRTRGRSRPGRVIIPILLAALVITAFFSNCKGNGDNNELALLTLLAASGSESCDNASSTVHGDSASPAGCVGIAYFEGMADDGSSDYELWRTDGTDEGTYPVKDINPSGSSYPQKFVELNGNVIFVARESSSNP